MSKTTAALIVGLLVGAACSTNGGIIADALAETVEPVVSMARDIAYDAEASGLAAEDVQAAIDEVVARVEKLEAQTAGLELQAQAILDLQAENEDLKESLAGFEARLAVLETPQPAPSCPDGFFDLGFSCMEEEAREPKTWGSAVVACQKEDLRLCNAYEYEAWCLPPALGPSPDGIEFTGSRDSSNVILFAPEGDSSWTRCKLDPLAQSSILSTSHPYRCCTDKD